MLTFLLIHSFHAMHAYIHSRICDWSIEREFSRIPVFFIGNPVSLRYPCSTCSPVIFRTIRTLNHGLCHSTWCIAFMRCMHKRIHGSKVKVVNAEFRGFGFFFLKSCIIAVSMVYLQFCYFNKTITPPGTCVLLEDMMATSLWTAVWFFTPFAMPSSGRNWNCSFDRERDRERDSLTQKCKRYSSVSVWNLLEQNIQALNTTFKDIEICNVLLWEWWHCRNKIYGNNAVDF